ncbi:MAG TPA: type II toxin-antitoxin system Phd/YefM family antitoxin [Anaerolineae bacterium]|nr:type II toxin-antitoxin system Phd/YefM family antitoxin [Anaerolineae bacterium]
MENIMSIHVGAREARNKFADLMGQVHYGKETIIVERSGKPMVAMIPVDMFEKMIAEREARFQVLDRIKSRLPDVPEEKVLQDVAEALSAVRKMKKAE